MVKIGAAQFRNLKKCPHRTPKKPEFGHKWSIKPGFPLVDLFSFAYLNSPYRDLKRPHSGDGHAQLCSAVLKKAGIRHFRHYPLPTEFDRRKRLPHFVRTVEIWCYPERTSFTMRGATPPAAHLPR